MRILLVEDDDAIRDVTSWTLTDAGYEVRSAANGRQALVTLSDWTPRLVLLDYYLPDLNGAACVQALRALLGPGIPIIAFTAAPSGPMLAACALDGYLAKPYDVEQLLALVEQYALPPQSSAA
jgi:CheY-like chemotaxis protein